MKVETVTHLEDRGIRVTPSDRIYYKKFPYRVDLGGTPTLYQRNRSKINKTLVQLDSQFRKTQCGTFYVAELTDAERLVDIGLAHQCNVHVTGPVSDSHAQALTEHQRETQVIRKKPWYSRYDIRIRTNWCVYNNQLSYFQAPNPEWFWEMIEFVHEQLNSDEYKIWYRRLYNNTLVPQTIYINSNESEAVVGFLKMQFYDPNDRYSPIREFTRAVIVDGDS